MARLWKHGFEVARIEVRDPDHRTVFSYRSDGHILRCLHVYMDATPYRDAHWHSYGWKLYRRYSDRAITPERIAASARKMEAGFKAREKDARLVGRVNLTESQAAWGA